MYKDSPFVTKWFSESINIFPGVHIYKNSFRLSAYVITVSLINAFHMLQIYGCMWMPRQSYQYLHLDNRCAKETRNMSNNIMPG